MNPEKTNPTPSRARMRQYAPIALILAAAAMAVAAYLQALDYPFISDDISYIPENKKLLELHLSELWRLFIEPYNCCFEFLPLRDFSYWLDIKLFGSTPAASRTQNILLHLLCLPLVYATTAELWRYFRPTDAASAPWAAAAVAALFALHPALVESVVWVSGRKYVLPNLFSMLALWFTVRSRREHGLSAPHAAAALAAFGAVMLSKSSYVAVAPVIAMLWVVFWLDIPAPHRRRSLLLWPLAILFLAGLLTLIFIVHNKGFDGFPFYFGVEAVTRTLAVLGWLARLAVSPEGRHFFYPVFEDPRLPAMAALGAVVLAATLAGGIMLLRKRSLEGFALAAFLLLCIPYIQLLPHGAPSLVADRYLALAVWPAVLLLVALCWRLRPVSRIVLLLAIALPWGFQTAERTRDWSSFGALMSADLRTYPGYYLPAMYIMEIQLRHSLFHEASETANSITVPVLRDIMSGITRASMRTKDATTANPHETVTLLQNLGLTLKQPPVQVEWNASMSYAWYYCKNILLTWQWRRLAEQFPDDAPVRYNAGLWMVDTLRHKNAAAHLRAATESQQLPESVRGTAFYSLGLALINSEQVAEAEAPLRAALEQRIPDLRAHCLLADVYKQTGRPEEAARAEASCPNRASNKETAR